MVETRHHGARVADGPALLRRPLTPADAVAVLALVNETERDLYGEPMIDLGDLLSDWQVPAFDLERDSLGLWHGDDLVARAELSPRGRIEVAAARGWRDQGLETELLDVVEARARARGLTAVDQFVPEGDRGGLDRFRQRGYRQDHTSWVLRLDPGAPVAGRTLPAGYQVRPFHPEDAAAAFTVITEAFGEWESGPTRSFADWEAQSLRRPGVDTANFQVATCQGQVVGTCVVFDGADEAWVSQLAVHREHRGRGLAQQRLAEAYAAARQRGLPHGGLSTDDRTGRSTCTYDSACGCCTRCTTGRWSCRPSGPAPILRVW